MCIHVHVHVQHADTCVGVVIATESSICTCAVTGRMINLIVAACFAEGCSTFGENRLTPRLKRLDVSPSRVPMPQ